MHKSVLIASPYSSFGELLRTSLEESGNYSAHIVHTGNEAAAIASKVAFDLVILDCDLEDSPLPLLGNKIFSLLPNTRLVVVPPNNNPFHPLLLGLKAHGYLNRPFYMPSMLKLIDEVMHGQSTSLVEMKESTPTPINRFSWLSHPDHAQPFLAHLLQETSSHALVITRVGNVLLHSGSLKTEEAEEISKILGRYWDSTGKSDLARFIHLESENGDFLLYAAALLEDLILGLVYDTNTPISQSRQQTKHMVRLLTTETPESYAEKYILPEDSLEKWIASDDAIKSETQADLPAEIINELLEDRSSAYLSGNPAGINPDWSPELSHIQQIPTESIDLEDDFSLWLEKRNGNAGSILSMFEEEMPDVDSGQAATHTPQDEQPAPLDSSAPPEGQNDIDLGKDLVLEDHKSAVYEVLEKQDQIVLNNQDQPELIIKSVPHNNATSQVPEWLEGLIPLPEDRGGFLSYENLIDFEDVTEISQTEVQQLDTATDQPVIETNAQQIDAQTKTERATSSHLREEVSPLTEDVPATTVDDLSKILDVQESNALTDNTQDEYDDSPALNPQLENPEDNDQTDHDDWYSDDLYDSDNDSEFEAEHINLETLLASLPSPDPEKQSTLIGQEWSTETDTAQTNQPESELDFHFPWDTPSDGSSGIQQGDTLPVKLTDRSKQITPLSELQDDNRMRQTAERGSQNGIPSLLTADPSENESSHSEFSSPPLSPLTHLGYTCILIPRVPHHHLTGELAENLDTWITDLCVAFGWQLQGHTIRPDYMQWIVQVTPTVSPGNLMRIIRQRTSYRIFNAFPNLGEENPSGDFWAPGYLVVSGTQSPGADMLQDFIQQTRRRQGINVKS